MRKLIAVGSGIALLLPVFAMAAADDVSLTTSVQLSVNSVTINVSGSTATVESITVGATTFSFTLADGSFIQLTAPDRNKLTADLETYATVNTCTSELSKLEYTATGAATITVTPLAALCNTATSGGGGSTSGGGGGGGGGATPATPATPAKRGGGGSPGGRGAGEAGPAPPAPPPSPTTLASPTTPATPATPAT